MRFENGRNDCSIYLLFEELDPILELRTFWYTELSSRNCQWYPYSICPISFKHHLWVSHSGRSSTQESARHILYRVCISVCAYWRTSNHLMKINLLWLWRQAAFFFPTGIGYTHLQFLTFSTPLRSFPYLSISMYYHYFVLSFFLVLPRLVGPLFLPSALQKGRVDCTQETDISALAFVRP